MGQWRGGRTEVAGAAGGDQRGQTGVLDEREQRRRRTGKEAVTGFERASQAQGG